MTQRSAYLFQILEKIGAPLLAAADSHTSSQEMPVEATTVAELLTRAVQAGVELSIVMDVESGTDSESIRLALTGLASSLIAGQYRTSGRIPSDADIKRLVTALSASLTFADNFSPAAGNTARLAALDVGAPPADNTQVMMQCLQALTPLVHVIAAYPFGRPETKMIQDVTERLVRQSGMMTARLLPGAAPTDIKQAELVLMRALAPLYCEAHKSETQRLMALDENARNQLAQSGGGNIPLDRLWQDFDRQAAMLDILVQALLKGLSIEPPQTSAQSGGPVIPQEMPVASPVIPSAAPVTPLAPPPSTTPPQGPFNPMAFFKPGATPENSSEGENT